MFSQHEREIVYRAIETRRDVRSGFTGRPLEPDVLARILHAAHCAPSVGLMQPSRFLLVRKREIRQAIHDIFTRVNRQATEAYTGAQRQHYESLKLEGILQAPQNLCVLCDADSSRGHGLGRQTMPETAIYSTVCAIQNLWLAARAEGVGVGWVSILDPAGLRNVLNVPAHIVPVAYLCLGYVDSFEATPELERKGWETRVPLASVLSFDTYTTDGSW